TSEREGGEGGGLDRAGVAGALGELGEEPDLEEDLRAGAVGRAGGLRESLHGLGVVSAAAGALLAEGVLEHRGTDRADSRAPGCPILRDSLMRSNGGKVIPRCALNGGRRRRASRGPFSG